MNDESKSALNEAAALIARGGCVVLTGAGISVASGIPHFRSKGGLWEKFDPMQYATSAAWKSDPDKVWKLFRATGSMILRSQPNPAHNAIAQLEQGGWVDGVVTQNIDGLHQAAGSSNVIEFHGNSVDIYCEDCGRTFERQEALGFLEGEGSVNCPDCNGLVRPSVVLFGEPIPQNALRDAASLASGCNSMLVVGTSAVVAPASLLPVEASTNGASIIEINPEPTELTSRAHIVARGAAETILPDLVSLVEALAS